MKRSIIALAAVFAVLAWMSSCDKLEAPYAVKKTGGDTTTGMVRKVLLEDYTGHKCVNCPEAALAARALEKSLHGQLIVIAVHAGFFAEPAATGDFTADYTTLTGNEWNTYFNITANPNGLVNRSPSGSPVLGPDLWANAINEQIDLPQEANISISTDYDAPTRHLEVTLDSRFLSLLDGAYNLTVCITEDSLVSPQKNNNPDIGYPTPIIYDYVFMDVLRGSVNGTWGEEISNDVDTSMTYRKSYAFTLDAAWTAKNCHVVAFVSKAETKEIIQAEKKAILSE